MPEGTPRPRAVGFDLDGTLIDTAPDLATGVNGMLAALSLPPLDEGRIPGMIGDGVENLVRRALAASAVREPLAAGYFEQALALFRQSYAAHLFDRSRVYPQVIETLQALGHAGLALCCVTNKETRLAQLLMQQAGLEPYVRFTLGPPSAPERKPSPAMLIQACTRLSVSPAELLYVGDSLVDMQAAHAAGCRAVAVSYGYDPRIRNGEGKPEALLASIAGLQVQGLAL